MLGTMPASLDEILAKLREIEAGREQDGALHKDLAARLVELVARVEPGQMATVTETFHRAVRASGDATCARALEQRAHRDLENALLALTGAAATLPDLPPVENVFRPALATVKSRAIPRPPDLAPPAKPDPDDET